MKRGGLRTGKPNKITADIKENVIAVFTRLGSTAGMAKWAKENQSDFYKAYMKMAPREVKAEVRHMMTECDLSDAQLAEIALGGRIDSPEASALADESKEFH